MVNSKKKLMSVLQTPRLTLEHASFDDAEFIYTLLIGWILRKNTEEKLEYMF